ncbi:MAG: NUDIX hydrolase [Phyllobacterium sp.]
MKTIRIAAAVIRDDAGRFLLVRKRGTTAFMQPGGKIDGSEGPAECLVRELGEELGLDIAPDEICFAARMSAPAAHEEGAIVEAALFHVSLGETQQPCPANEIEEIVWHDADDRQRPLALLTRDIVMRFGPAAG